MYLLSPLFTIDNSCYLFVFSPKFLLYVVKFVSWHWHGLKARNDKDKDLWLMTGDSDFRFQTRGSQNYGSTRGKNLLNQPGHLFSWLVLPNRRTMDHAYSDSSRNGLIDEKSHPSAFEVIHGKKNRRSRPDWTIQSAHSKTPARQLAKKKTWTPTQSNSMTQPATTTYEKGCKDAQRVVAPSSMMNDGPGLGSSLRPTIGRQDLEI